MGFFASIRRLLAGAPFQENHLVDPGTFLRRLREHEPDRLTIERLTDVDGRKRLRFTFDHERFEDGSWRLHRYSIMFDAQFVPPPFRHFCERAAWEEEEGRAGLVRHPHRGLR